MLSVEEFVLILDHLFCLPEEIPFMDIEGICFVHLFLMLVSNKFCTIMLVFSSIFAHLTLFELILHMKLALVLIMLHDIG